MDMAWKTDETVRTLLNIKFYVVQGNKLRLDLLLRT